MINKIYPTNQINIKKVNMVLDDFITVEEAYLTYPKFDGSMSPEVRRLNVNRGDSCCAVLYDKDSDCLLLINQFRYPSSTKGQAFLLELPAGMIEHNDSPRNTMIREVLEETGYEVKDPELIRSFFTTPGISSERCFLFYFPINRKIQKQKEGGLVSENEDIQIMWLPTKQIVSFLQNDSIQDAKTIIGLQWFLMDDRFVRK